MGAITQTNWKKKYAKKQIKEQYDIDSNYKILLFNGTLDYKPNVEAVEYIIKNINPTLLKKTGFLYKIIICGKGLPAIYNDLKDFKNQNIIYAGFVDDINLFFKGADIFLNPVITGGGIKTKLVEALGNNLTSISCRSGAFGIPTIIAQGKLIVVNDFDWNSFSDAIFSAKVEENISTTFFNYFYWGNIAAKAANIISGNTIIQKWKF